jgi:hypothetical protein
MAGGAVRFRRAYGTTISTTPLFVPVLPLGLTNGPAVVSTLLVPSPAETVMRRTAKRPRLDATRAALRVD